MSGFLDAFRKESESQFNVKNKYGEPSNWVWTFAGPGHPATVAADERLAKRNFALQEEQEKARVNGRKWKGSGDSFEEARDRNIDYIIGRLLRWTQPEGSEPFPCTPENARQALLDPASDIYADANSFLMDEKSFTPRSPKDSQPTPSATSN